MKDSKFACQSPAATESVRNQHLLTQLGPASMAQESLPRRRAGNTLHQRRTQPKALQQRCILKLHQEVDLGFLSLSGSGRCMCRLRHVQTESGLKTLLLSDPKTHIMEGSHCMVMLACVFKSASVACALQTYEVQQTYNSDQSKDVLIKTRGFLLLSSNTSSRL